MGIALAVVCSLAWPNSARADGSALRVSYYPQAVYAGEPALFELQAETGLVVSAHMDGTQLAEMHPTPDGTAELSLAVEMPGVLTFRQGDAEFMFEVVFPDSRAPITEESGFLWSAGRPAILVAHHRYPPKHDRRWEIAHLIKKLFSDTRPEIGSGTIVGASFMSADMAGRLDELSGTRQGFWSRVTPPDCLSEINSLIVSRDQAASNTAMIVVALSSRDLRRGIDRLEYRIKVEWHLQGLQVGRAAELVLAAPPLTERETRQFGDTNRELAASAAANLAMFARPGQADVKTGVDEEAWFRAVLARVGKGLRLH